MSIKFKTHFKWKEKEVIALIKDTCKQVAEHIGSDVKQEAITLIESSTGGSKAPPKSRTGQLIRSIEYKTNETNDGIEVEVGVWDPVRAQIAMWLEYGTSRMNPHPFLRPAWRKVVSRLGKYFRR